MSGIQQLAGFSAPFGDLLREAKVELDDDSFGDLLVLASAAIAKLVAERLETEPANYRCRCGRTFAWPGELEAHEHKCIEHWRPE